MQPLGKNGLVYLAAAVSDFYIPYKDLSEHKIQSKDNANGLTLSLEPIPKMLGILANEWAPESFVISFKVIRILFISYLAKLKFKFPSLKQKMNFWNQKLWVH